MAEHGRIKLSLMSVADQGQKMYCMKRTVKRFACSRYPGFEPAKRQSIDRMKAVRERTIGRIAE